MGQSATLYVPNSILFLWDLQNKKAEIPQYEDNQLISSNPNCISIGTLMELDGPTTVSFLEVASGLAPIRAFSGLLNAPSGEISISSSEADSLLCLRVAGVKANIEIFVNDPSEPSLIEIVVQS